MEQPKFGFEAQTPFNTFEELMPYVEEWLEWEFHSTEETGPEFKKRISDLRQNRLELTQKQKDEGTYNSIYDPSKQLEYAMYAIREQRFSALKNKRDFLKVLRDAKSGNTDELYDLLLDLYDPDEKIHPSWPLPVRDATARTKVLDILKNNFRNRN